MNGVTLLRLKTWLIMCYKMDKRAEDSLHQGLEVFLLIQAMRMYCINEDLQMFNLKSMMKLGNLTSIEFFWTARILPMWVKSVQLFRANNSARWTAGIHKAAHQLEARKQKIKRTRSMFMMSMTISTWSRFGGTNALTEIWSDKRKNSKKKDQVRIQI